MKLSMAIRVGATLRPQAFGPVFENGCSCALGAALEGSNVWEYTTKDFITLKVLIELFGGSNIDPIKDISCPVCFSEKPTYTVIGFHLNDLHKWTRETIADWVEANLETPDEVTVEKVGELVEVGK